MSLLLQMSFAGGMLIAVIALLRLFLQKYVHRSVFLLLWFLAVVRLLVPILPPSEASIYNLPVFTQEETREIVTVYSGEAADFVTQNVQTASPTAPALPVVEAARPALSAEKLLLLIWAGVAVLLMAVFLAFHLRSCRRYRFSLPVPEGVERPKGLRVRMLDGLSAPLTYGVFRPVVLFPVDFPWEDSGRLKHILLHEQAHIRRHDVLKKYVFLLTACVHWFNPAVWLMFFLASQDMEMRCDAIAVKALGTGHKLDYAKTLVASETARVTGLLHTGFSFSTTAKRLQALIRTKNHPVISVLAAAVLALSLSAIFLTGQTAQAALPPVVLAPKETESLAMEAGESAFSESYLETFYVPSKNTAQPTEEPTQTNTTAPQTVAATTHPTERVTENFRNSYEVRTYINTLFLDVGQTQTLEIYSNSPVIFYTSDPSVAQITTQGYVSLDPAYWGWTGYYYAEITIVAEGFANISFVIDNEFYYFASLQAFG